MPVAATLPPVVTAESVLRQGQLSPGPAVSRWHRVSAGAEARPPGAGVCCGVIWKGLAWGLTPGKCELDKRVENSHQGSKDLCPSPRQRGVQLMRLGGHDVKLLYVTETAKFPRQTNSLWIFHLGHFASSVFHRLFYSDSFPKAWFQLVPGK